MSKLRALALIIGLSAAPALAAETIEAIGAEACGDGAAGFTVEFLAPEDAALEARAHVLVGGTEETREATALSLDGKPCEGERCGFEATKGQTYVLAADGTGSKEDRLCISVVRP